MARGNRGGRGAVLRRSTRKKAKLQDLEPTTVNEGSSAVVFNEGEFQDAGAVDVISSGPQVNEDSMGSMETATVVSQKPAGVDQDPNNDYGFESQVFAKANGSGFEGETQSSSSTDWDQDDSMSPPAKSQKVLVFETTVAEKNIVQQEDKSFRIISAAEQEASIGQVNLKSGGPPPAARNVPLSQTTFPGNKKFQQQGEGLGMKSGAELEIHLEMMKTIIREHLDTFTSKLLVEIPTKNDEISHQCEQGNGETRVAVPTYLVNLAIAAFATACGKSDYNNMEVETAAIRKLEDQDKITKAIREGFTAHLNYIKGKYDEDGNRRTARAVQ